MTSLAPTWVSVARPGQHRVTVIPAPDHGMRLGQLAPTAGTGDMLSSKMFMKKGGLNEMIPRVLGHACNV